MKFRVKNSAQALVEFAIVLPLLMLVVMGAIGLGYILVANQVVTYAAREGARTASQINDNQQINGAVTGIISNLDKNTDRTKINVVPLDTTDPSRTRGNNISVEVVYTVPFKIPIISSSDNYQVRSKSIAKIEYENTQ